MPLQAGSLQILQELACLGSKRFTLSQVILGHSSCTMRQGYARGQFFVVWEARPDQRFLTWTVVSHHLANDVASGDDSPLSPVAAVVVGVLFLLRELELSAIDMEDVSFTDTTITLSLPVSKVDWQAKGCRRTWSCKCDVRYYCPVHILRQYADELRREGKHTVPWIISRTDGRCSKNAVVTKIRQAVLSSGGTAKNAEDNWIISGHTFRITGARTLSAWGLDPITIQLLGRWGPNAVLSYLAATPLLSFSDRLTNRSAESHLSARHVAATDLDGRQSAEIVAEQDQLRRELRELKAEMSDLSTTLDGVSQVLGSKQVREIWWVLNDISKVLHEAIVDLCTPPSTWKTACGWKFSGQPRITTFRDSPPFEKGRKCPKCVPESDTSSSDDTESS